MSGRSEDRERAPRLTILTAGHNECENLPEFLARLDHAIKDVGVPAEVVFINDGSTDGSREILDDLRRTYGYLRVVHRPRRRGLAEFLNTGIRLARGELVMILPSDLESDPEEDVPKLLAELERGADAVSGWRQGRRGRKALFSAMYNRACCWLFGLSLHDIDWIKGFRRGAVAGLHFRSGWHRFMIPMIAHRGYRVTEVPTSWHPRRRGRSKFGWRSLGVTLFDALTVRFLLSFGSQPMLFFGGAGAAFLLLALASSLAVVLVRPWSPLLIAATVGLSLSALASFLAGLVAELCCYHLDGFCHGPGGKDPTEKEVTDRG